MRKPGLRTACQETEAVAALGFVVFLVCESFENHWIETSNLILTISPYYVVFAYTMLVTILSIRAEQLGKRAWTDTVQNAFSPPASDEPWTTDYKGDIPIDAIVHYNPAVEPASKK